MAVQSQHDVVNQSLSMGGLPSVDVSAPNTTVPAARAADFDVSKHTTADQQPIFANDLPRAVSDASENVKQDSAPEIRVAGASDNTLEEEAKRSVLGEGSVGSDTDTSRTDGMGLGAKDAEGRDGTSRSAVKKSASFKPVSVTKNFLAKAGSATASTKSTNGSEKAAGTPNGSPGPSLQNTPRPRLVAKSISGQKAALPKTVASSGSASGTPDPNQVWNKNRVQVQTATPKHLTDEELRQQYGIQLASRPIEDPDSNQAKWADIDDEDDDWAPETIEWNDGTKINLAETAAAQAAAAAAETEKEKETSQTVAAKPSTLQAKPSTAGANPTVLKLGSATQKTAPASLKSSSEKPTLVAKPSAPAPIKSPWATLPTVEKVSPVLINAPATNQPSRLSQRDAHGFDAMPPPAKEMEADDFSRLSRDTANGNPRELYIPHSGRYEPVNDARRQSVRREGNFRQPAVLQRPSQAERDPSGPAEPSAAFQTNRAQQDGQPWGRRRGSSSASMENGRYPRRTSIGRSYDPQLDGPARRGSQYEQGRNASPSHSHGVSAASQSPTISTAADPTAASGQAQTQDENATIQPAQVTEDIVTAQRRLMREKREAAVKRRQEEEAREAAERRERIRLHMEKIGLNSEKDDKASNTERKPDESANATVPTLAVKETKDVRPTLPESPPKPPIPSPSGEPQQYGLMKVHAPQPAHLTSPRGMAARPPQHAPNHEHKNAPRTEPKPQAPQSNQGEASSRSAELLSPNSDPLPKETGVDARSWPNVPQQPASQFPNWGSTSMATHSPQGGNLWGPPSNHRALGNGDFQSNIQRASLKPPQPPYSGQSASAPQPIGTPRQFNQQSRNAPAVSSSKSDLLAGTIIEDLQTMPSFPSETERHARPQAELSSDARSPIGHHHHLQTSPNIPPKAHTQPIEAPQTGVAAWTHFSQTSGGREAEQAAQEHAARMAEQQLGLARGAPSLPNLNETWKQVKRGDGQGTRQVVGATKVMNNYAPSSMQSQTMDFDKTIAPPSRSRYQDIFEHQHRFAAPVSPNMRSLSPTLPPPDSAEHPAFGMHNRPLVNLPGRKIPEPEPESKPIVKLPPPKQLPPPPPRIVNTRSLSYSNAVKADSNTTWQNRIDSLLDRENKFPSPPVLSATKPHFDVGPSTTNTAVSLPRRLTEAFSQLDKSVEEEEALFEEERAFGSTPTIRVPQKVAVHISDMAPRPDYKKLWVLRDENIATVRQAILIPGEDVHHANSNISIMLPGMDKAVLKPYTRKGQAAHRITKPSGRQKPRTVHKPRNAGDATSGSLPAGGSKGKSGVGARHPSYNRRTSGAVASSG